MAEKQPDDWKTARQHALERDGYRCRRCGNDERGELDVHHRMPRALKVDHSPANLITLCDTCHAGIHLNLQVSLARRVIQRWAVRIARLVDRAGDLPPENLDLTPVLQALHKERLLPGQLHVILAILRGDDVLAVRPTGSGKSMCFQVPTLLRDGYALVVEPLKALMKNQVSGLHDLTIPATFINGDLSLEERERRYELLDANAWKFVYVAPERFDPSVVHPTEVSRATTLRPRFLVVDEAHSIVQYGSSFRPMYAQLGRVRDALGRPPVLAFTATAAVETQKAICASLGMDAPTVIVEDPDRPNISLTRIPIRRDDPGRLAATKKLLDGIGDGRAIIFVPTVRIGEEVQQGLRGVGVDLEFFHANAHTANWRDMTQGRFEGKVDPPIQAIIATSAFGMGLDIPDVRLVVSWQHPFSVEEYVQAFGRAGRDGQPARAVVFVDEANDRGLLEYMIDRQPAGDGTRQRSELGRIVELTNDRHRCFRSALLSALDASSSPQRPLPIRILEWAFARSRTRHATGPCCDACNPELLAGLYQRPAHRRRPPVHGRSRRR